MKRAPAHEPPEASRVKAVNIAYYKALSARDMCAMEKVWTCASDNILIAPPINPRTHVGWTAIKQRGLLAHVRQVLCVHDRYRGQYQRAGCLGPWYRNVAPPHEDGRCE